MKTYLGIIAGVIFATVLGIVLEADSFPTENGTWFTTLDDSQHKFWIYNVPQNMTRNHVDDIEPVKYGDYYAYFYPHKVQQGIETMLYEVEGEETETLRYANYAESWITPVVELWNYIYDLEDKIAIEVKRQIVFETKLTELQKEISELKYEIELLKGN